MKKLYTKMIVAPIALLIILAIGYFIINNDKTYKNYNRMINTTLTSISNTGDTATVKIISYNHIESIFTLSNGDIIPAHKVKHILAKRSKYKYE